MSEQAPPPTGDPNREPTEEELRAYGERLRQIRVEDVIVETIGPLLNIGTLRAGLVPGHEDEADLEQLGKAIDASRALLPLVERELGPQGPAVKSAVSNLQVAYAQLARQSGAQAPGEGAPAPGPEGAPPAADAGAQPPPGAPAEDEIKPGEPGPAQRSGRLWVPGQ
jgi:hypothetical protein